EVDAACLTRRDVFDLSLYERRHAAGHDDAIGVGSEADVQIGEYGGPGWLVRRLRVYDQAGGRLESPAALAGIVQAEAPELDVPSRRRLRLHQVLCEQRRAARRQAVVELAPFAERAIRVAYFDHPVAVDPDAFLLHATLRCRSSRKNGKQPQHQ